MKLVRLTKENLESEHICCAISNNKDVQVQSKKAWLSDRLDEGLVFLKGDVRGKCFIEYLPAEFAWVPVEAEGYIFINCLWVSGKYKGQGNSNLLLEECIRDSKAKGKNGLCIISSDKKRPFLSDPKYLAYKGFFICDSAEPYFRLMYLPFDSAASQPKFLPKARLALTDCDGLVIYYTNQCPFTAKYVPVMCKVAEKMGVPVKVVKIENLTQAKNTPCAVTSFVLFKDGKYFTNEIFSEKKFTDFCTECKKAEG